MLTFVPGPGNPKNRAWVGRNRAPRAQGKLAFPQDAPTKWSPDRQAEVGDQFAQGVQVNSLNSEL